MRKDAFSYTQVAQSADIGERCSFLCADEMPRCERGKLVEVVRTVNNGRV